MAAAGSRTAWRLWSVCGILFLASAINYMDRLTLANASVRITREFHLDEEQYGRLELVFGWAFAAGSLLSGWLADRVSLRWFYPLVLALWSGVGFATGCVRSYGGLLLCRALLGLFEAGHWPCAVKTTRLLDPADRTMGNGILMGGVSIGAVAASLVMGRLMTAGPGGWRMPFQAIGAFGLVWVAAWFVLLPRGAAAEASEAGAEEGGFGRILFSRKFLLLAAVAALINATFQIVRAWLPRILIEGRGYTESAALHVNALYYVACDVGSLAVGAAALWMHRRGTTAHRAHLAGFGGSAALVLLCAAAAALPRGPLLVAVFLLVGAGALGVYPVFQSLSQELSRAHQGKVTGLATVAGWAVSSPLQVVFGRWVDRTHSFDAGLRIIGLLPFLAFVLLYLFWKEAPREPMISRYTG